MEFENSNAKWITSGEFLVLEPQNVFHRQLDKSFTVDNTIQNRHILFRKEFFLDACPEHAILSFSADDYAKIYINGKFVDQGPGPGYVDHYLYQKTDVTPFLKAGRNVIAVHTYYQGYINRVWVSGDNRHGFICELSDGDKQILVTDDSFKTAVHTAFSTAGSVGYYTQFMERYDANAREVGFEQPDYDDSSWADARLVPHPDYKLFPTPLPSLVFEDVSPVSVEERGDCLQIDFGAIYVGYLTLTAKGRAGDTVDIRFAQELNDDGSIRWHLRANCNYREYFILSGKEDVLNEFDYKSFRYVELRAPKGVNFDGIRVVARHMPFELKKACRYDDTWSKAIWNLCVRSLKVGVQEQIMDCMEREKGYYLGDGCYTMLTWCTLTDDFTPMLKFIDDFLRTSFINGGLVTCANCSFMQEIAEYPFMMFVLLPVLVEKGYGDFVRERLPALKAIIDYYRDTYSLESGLLCNLDKWCVVEWPKNMQDGYDADVTEGKVCTALHNVINAWYIGAIKIYNGVAERLGGETVECAKLEKAFIDCFYDSEKHLFKDSDVSSHISFPGNIYAWYLGIIPDGGFEKAVIELVRERRLRAGMLFIVFPLFSSLRRAGEEELLHSLLTDENTWRAMLAEGATTTFEAWTKETKWNTSLFHLTLSCAAYFMVK